MKLTIKLIKFRELSQQKRRLLHNNYNKTNLSQKLLNRESIYQNKYIYI